MNRLGIFSIYDKDGVLDDATLSTIQDLKTCLSYLVVVVNGSLRAQDALRLDRISNQLIFRENSGFDAGAYKDVLFHRLDSETIRSFDEIVLCNDTFYGPFIPFREIFATMSTKDWDFWGFRHVKDNLIEHIQSYLYCFSSSVFQKAVLPYFEERISEHARQITEVYACFEQGLFAYLVQQNFRFATYARSSLLQLYGASYYLLTEDHLPILKKKCFDPAKYVQENVFESLRYIYQHYHYDIVPILASAHRKYGFSVTAQQILNSPPQTTKRLLRETGITATRESLLQFLSQFSACYIYGAGFWGQILYEVCVRSTGKMQGFVCSDEAHVPASRQALGVPVYPLCDVHPDTDTGMIVALSAENTHQVKPLLGESPAVYYLYD